MKFFGNAAVLFLIFLLLVSYVPVMTQRPKPAPQRNTPLVAKTPALKKFPLIFDELDDFVAKGLPAAANVPDQQNPDAAAIILAAQISKYDKNSLPLLLNALQLCGFTIVDENRKVLRVPPGDGKGQGLAFYDFEAVGSLKLAKRGLGTNLDKIAETITKDVPQMPPAQFADLMLQDIRTATSSDNVSLRFWARLIVELGKSASLPVDMMTAGHEKVSLSVLQATLITRRLQGDFYVLRHQLGIGERPRPVLPRTSFTLASWTPDATLYAPRVARPANFDCELTNDEALFLDGAAVLLTYGNGKVVEKVGGLITSAGGQAAFGKLALGLTGANLALGWLKLVASVTMLRGEITVENPPLIRTINAQPGERRLMKARIWNEVGKIQMLNCVRAAINAATGLDFNLPTDGPAGNVSIEWHFAGDNETSVNSAETRNLQKFVIFESPQGADPNPQKQVTDDDGISTMYLVGAPKVPAVVYQKNPIKVEKEANVLVGVTLKSAKDVKQNALDLLGIVLGVATGGPLGILAALPEIGFRLPYVTARATIPVIDHEPCDGQWQGTIFYTSIFSTTGVETISRPQLSPSARGAGSTGGQKKLDDTITQSGSVTVNGNYWFGNSSADEIFTSEDYRSGKFYCHGGLGGPIGPLVPVTSRETVVSFGGGTTQGRISGSISLTEDGYSISLKPPGINGRFQTTSQNSSSGGCPPPKASKSFSVSSDRQYGSNDPIIGKALYGTDRNTLSGSDSTTRSTPSKSQSGSIVVSTVDTLTWNLRRCN